MQHVKLARDRRKRKSRIKAAVFLLAILSIFIGIVLSVKDNAKTDPLAVSSDEVQYKPLNETQEAPQTQTNSEFQDIQANENITEHSQENQSDITNTEKPNSDEATSYDDDLQGKDDEVEQVNLDDEDEFADLPEDAKNAVNDLLDVADQAIRIKDQFSHTVVKGDSLKDVLEQSGLEDETSKTLIAAYPELKNLKAGQQFYWILDKDGELEYLNWLVSEKEERIYERTAEGKFKRQILQKKSVWKKEVLKGQIKGSFSSSLKAQGLNSKQISQLGSALQWQISMKKLKQGDKFAVLVSREYLDNKLTGQGNVEAIHISSGGKSYYAIQSSNGRYYNRQGETLGKGFARYPMQRQARVSSPFNPARRHPVTGRIRPHKGVDFSMAIGTPVIAPADGIVEKVAYQANGAGRYIMIRHGREYQTVYMHLSRPLVRAGQRVKRGERIALSGNTGRSTGPHLHYEFHINGRPVNPLTVKLPGTSSQMSTAERKQFLVKAKEAERKLKI
ncbi:murein DD-endopeptidase MepM [Avibacterium gallinarum]|uniref:murein DD-endopeptidase MepM n=1 Tax=Avibacterium gallinarum TaxID=755 RepID=UPI0039FC769D